MATTGSRQVTVEAIVAAFACDDPVVQHAGDAGSDQAEDDEAGPGLSHQAADSGPGPAQIDGETGP